MKIFLSLVGGVLIGAMLLYGGCRWALTCIVSSQTPPPVKVVELWDVMHDLQRISDKIYFSGVEKNKTLTEWYMWKLRYQTMQVIEHKTVPWYPPHYDEGDLFDKMLLPAIAELDNVIENEQWGNFEESYSDLIQACNSCHMMTKHEYVRIQIPKAPAFSNQDYSLISE